MLIVITILVLVSGVIGINVRQAYIQQRFRTEVDLMVDTLRLAQDMMLVLNRDVHVRVKVAEDGSGFLYWMEVEGGIPKNWQKVVRSTPRRLTAARLMDFIEQNPALPVVSNELDFRFFSGGSLMSRGLFRIGTHEDRNYPGALNRVVLLRGYPHPIDSVPEEEEPLELVDSEGEAFDSQLTNNTMQEVLEDTPPPPKEPQKAEPPAPEPPKESNEGQ